MCWWLALSDVVCMWWRKQCVVSWCCCCCCDHSSSLPSTAPLGGCLYLTPSHNTHTATAQQHQRHTGISPTLLRVYEDREERGILCRTTTTKLQKCHRKTSAWSGMTTTQCSLAMWSLCVRSHSSQMSYSQLGGACFRLTSLSFQYARHIFRSVCP